MKNYLILSVSIMLLILSACGPGNLKIQVVDKKFQGQVNMIITGESFTPNGRVTITVRNFPKSQTDRIETVYAKNNGTFTHTFEFKNPAYANNQENLPDIQVIAQDEAKKQFVTKEISPWPYVIVP
ncbi:MAG: hypothetical protein SFU99_18320 [Saprospiraceae bacterium]|nr:hypothetical protein [Saprospiraceae bacterium]